MRMLYPYLPILIKRLTQCVSESMKFKHMKERDLNILTHLAEMVADSETCEGMIKVIVNVFFTKSLDKIFKSDSQCQLLKALGVLAMHVEKPRPLIR